MTRAIQPLPHHDDGLQTLARLHLGAEISPTRRAVLRWRVDGVWREMPSWRYYRQVIRVGLFLRERVGVKPGDRVLFASLPSAERVVAEWATVSLGAVAIAADFPSTDDDLIALCVELSPKAAFVDAPTGGYDARRIRASVPEVIALRPDSERAPSTAPLSPAPAGANLMAGDGPRSWSEVIDLGGTLDTAERAQSFRANARSVSTDMPALAYRERTNGARMTLVSHGEMAGRVQSLWKRAPQGEGNVAYVASGAGSAPVYPVCLPLWAFVADGRTCTALGTPGREAEEMRELRPRVIVATADLARAALPRSKPNAAAGPVPPRILGRLPVVGRAVDRWVRHADGDATEAPLCRILTFDGTALEERRLK